MKTFFLNRKLEGNYVSSFLNELAEYEEHFNRVLRSLPSKEDRDKVREKEIATIFIDCDGGELIYSGAIYDFFRNSRYKYTFVLGGSISSATFLVVMALSPDKVRVYKTSYSLIHYACYETDVNIDMFNRNGFEKSKKEEHKKLIDLLSSIFTDILPEEKLNHIQHGNDVMLSAEDLNILLKTLKQNEELLKKFRSVYELT